MEINRELLGDRHPSTINSMWLLARIYGGLGQYDESEAVLLEAYSLVKQLMGDRHVSTLRYAERLANLYEAWAQPDKATQYRGLQDIAQETLGTN